MFDKTAPGNKPTHPAPTAEELHGRVLDLIGDASDLLDREAVTGEPPGRDQTWQALLASGAVAHIPDRDNSGERLVPGFQFSADRSAVRLEVVAVNRVLQSWDAPTAAASWWVSNHAQLGGVRPCELVGHADFHDVLVWAQRDMDGIDN